MLLIMLRVEAKHEATKLVRYRTETYGFRVRFPLKFFEKLFLKKVSVVDITGLYPSFLYAILLLVSR